MRKPGQGGKGRVNLVRSENPVGFLIQINILPRVFTVVGPHC